MRWTRPRSSSWRAGCWRILYPRSSSEERVYQRPMPHTHRPQTDLRPYSVRNLRRCLENPARGVYALTYIHTHTHANFLTRASHCISMYSLNVCVCTQCVSRPGSGGERELPGRPSDTEPASSGTETALGSSRFLQEIRCWIVLQITVCHLRPLSSSCSS